MTDAAARYRVTLGVTLTVGDLDALNAAATAASLPSDPNDPGVALLALLAWELSKPELFGGAVTIAGSVGSSITLDPTGE